MTQVGMVVGMTQVGIVGPTTVGMTNVEAVKAGGKVAVPRTGGIINCA